MSDEEDGRTSCEIHLDYIHGRNEHEQPWVPKHAYDVIKAELDSTRHYRQQCREMEAANKHCHERIAMLEAAARNVIDEMDLTCMRASEEISVTEGCPCVVCVLQRLAALSGARTAKPEPNFLFDPGADFCDRHETAFKLGERCPKCSASGTANAKGEGNG
jgi:hypothetical protein